jgi:hypothetical protein
MLVTQIGAGSTAENLNKVVSAITFDFLAGTMTVEAHDGSLDVRSGRDDERSTRSTGRAHVVEILLVGTGRAKRRTHFFLPTLRNIGRCDS